MQLIQPGGLDARPALAGEVSERIITPQRQRLVVPGQRVTSSGAARGGARGLHQAHGSVQIHAIEVDVGTVSGRLPDDDVNAVRGERPPQLRDPQLQGDQRVGRQGLLRPQPVDERAGGDGPAR